jgi:hypothetical protein
MSEFYDPSGETRKHGDKLPHWQQDGVMQFITFRLGDALPQDKLDQWNAGRKVWLTHHPVPWTPEVEREYHREFTMKLERWLDEGAGSCILRDGDQRKILEDVLMHDHGGKAEHLSWVIMPNHVHLLFIPHAPLEKLIQTWKGVAGRRFGMGSVWQKNYRDTLIRDADHFANVVRYIRRNPAKLPAGTFTLWESPRALAVP